MQKKLQLFILNEIFKKKIIKQNFHFKFLEFLQPDSEFKMLTSDNQLAKGFQSKSNGGWWGAKHLRSGGFRRPQQRSKLSKKNFQKFRKPQKF